jgi:hypothetical protein
MAIQVAETMAMYVVFIAIALAIHFR